MSDKSWDVHFDREFDIDLAYAPLRSVLTMRNWRIAPLVAVAKWIASMSAWLVARGNKQHKLPVNSLLVKKDERVIYRQLLAPA